MFSFLIDTLKLPAIIFNLLLIFILARLAKSLFLVSTFMASYQKNTFYLRLDKQLNLPDVRRIVHLGTYVLKTRFKRTVSVHFERKTAVPVHYISIHFYQNLERLI